MTIASVHPAIDDLTALRALVGSRRPRAPLRGAQGTHGAPAGTQRGRGLEFAELRAYQPGDDVRSIDWRRSARHGQPCTKLFHAERERVLRLLVDLGPTMQFGTRGAFKSVAAARCAALLAWQAAQAGDRVAGSVGRLDGWHGTPPRARQAGVLALLRLLGAAPGQAAALSFAAGLQGLARQVSSNDRVVVCSDFRNLDAAAEELLVQIGRRAACVLVQIYDAFEAVPPPPGQYAFTDGKRETVVDFADATVRRRHVEAFAAHTAHLRELARRAGARLQSCATDTAPADFLAAF